MQVKNLGLIVLFFLGIILLMPFHEKFSMKNEAQASKQKVLLYIRKGTSGDKELMLTQEVGVMTSMLEEAGFEVIVATVSGEPIEAKTTELIPDLKLADVKVSDYVGIIVPCMAKGPAPYWHAAPEEIMLVKEAAAQGKPMAAQHGGIIILAEAGILVGKKYAYRPDPSLYKGFASAIYCGKGVVQDGNIITSSTCPGLTKSYGHKDGTSELTELFIKAIKK
jgi:putative intracellular protease/amidase